MTIFINILLVLEVLVAILIILLVLMQRPKNEGLGAAFGGGMTENLFGAQTTNVLQTFTRNLGIFFFALTGLISWLYVKQGVTKSDIQKQLSAAPAVAQATPAPVPPVVPVTGQPANTAGDLPPVEATKEGTTTPADPNAGAVPAKPGDPAAPPPNPPPALPPGEGSSAPNAAPVPVPATPRTPGAAPGAPAPAPATPENKPAENKPAQPAPGTPKPPQ